MDNGSETVHRVQGAAQSFDHQEASSLVRGRFAEGVGLEPTSPFGQRFSSVWPGVLTGPAYFCLMLPCRPATRPLPDRCWPVPIFPDAFVDKALTSQRAGGCAGANPGQEPNQRAHSNWLARTQRGLRTRLGERERGRFSCSWINLQHHVLVMTSIRSISSTGG